MINFTEMILLDKKLEASREEFAGLVDCVLATNEIPTLLEKCLITSFNDIEEASMIGL
jgi:iron only hydrogenase large subunit-like protein